MRYAKVTMYEVVNIVNSDVPLSDPWVASETAQIGDIYNPATGVFTSPDQTPPGSRKIVRVEWKMRIPATKYAALKNLVDSDPLVWAFFDILNDATLMEVNLDSPYLSGALDYLIETYPNLVSADDKAAWLA